MSRIVPDKIYFMLFHRNNVPDNFLPDIKFIDIVFQTSKGCKKNSDFLIPWMVQCTAGFQSIISNIKQVELFAF